MRLLIAEDDTKLLKSLKHIFEGNKYTVDAVSNGGDALDYAQNGEYDGIILDIMMPVLDGIEVLKKLRQSGNTVPIMMLTAKTEVYQRVEGLDSGADDYLPKPFATAELLARVRAMLRRKDVFSPEILEFCGVTLNCSAYTLSYQGKNVLLGGKEFQIAEALMANPEFIITSDTLINKVWGWNTDIDISVIWVYVSNLRKKLSEIGAPIEIKFVRGAGYRMEAAL